MGFLKDKFGLRATAYSFLIFGLVLFLAHFYEFVYESEIGFWVFSSHATSEIDNYDSNHWGSCSLVGFFLITFDLWLSWFATFGYFLSIFTIN